VRYCVPHGFKFAGIHCGIKRKRRDLAIIYSEHPCATAGVFTRNVVKAPPLIYDMRVLKTHASHIRAVVANSGNANACTGEEGLRNARRMAEKTAEVLNVPVESVLVSSTGVIGVQLPMDKIERGIEMAAKHLARSPLHAAEAIMTTDTRVKIAYQEVEIGGGKFTVLGIAKGSGMIHPNMATMLAFVVTDVKATPEILKKALIDSVNTTYNMISVDGDTSTNDMVLVMANGSSDLPGVHEDTEIYKKFFEALNDINTRLAKMIVKDGEGATKLFEVIVDGAPDEESARKIARSIVSSNLVKAAIYGEDANWGRILAAAGYSGAEFDPYKLDLYIESDMGCLQVAKSGEAHLFNEAKAKEILKSNEIKLRLEMNQGNGRAVAWGCDLTEEYVVINGRYRT